MMKKAAPHDAVEEEFGTVGVNVVKTHPESSDGFFKCRGGWCGSYKRVEDGVDAVSWSHDQTAADELRMWKKIA